MELVVDRCVVRPILEGGGGGGMRRLAWACLSRVGRCFVIVRWRKNVGSDKFCLLSIRKSWG